MRFSVHTPGDLHPSHRRLLPKDLKVEHRSPYEHMTEEEIDAKIRMLLTSVSAKDGPGLQ